MRSNPETRLLCGFEGGLPNRADGPAGATAAPSRCPRLPPMRIGPGLRDQSLNSNKEEEPLPQRWRHVQKAVYLTHKGVTVCRAYNNDDADDPLTYWFSWSPDDDGGEFDVRSLPLPQGVTDFDSDRDRRAVLRHAIDLGMLTSQGLKQG